MCGRYVVATPTSDLVGLFEIDEAGADLPEPNWNIPPTTTVPIVVEPSPRGDGPPIRRLEAEGLVVAEALGDVGESDGVDGKVGHAP